MTPERWKRTEELYHAAKELTPPERAAFLADACADDAALRRDVESLLAETVSGTGFLDGAAHEIGGRMMADTPPSLTGRRVGSYQLETLLGAGGMGEVYRARDITLGRTVAVKTVPAIFTSDPGRLARFEREARLLAALNHPNICSIYGVEEADGVRCLILELVEGDTLAERLARASRSQAGGSALPLAEALGIARQIADALAVAHEKGIIHRDLKPANIKIKTDGTVKVLDFGLARTVAADASEPSLTRAPVDTQGEPRGGAVIGTAAYMSPEQARGLAVDTRTDIWAFGCVLFEMLTGRVAFSGDTVSDTIAKILEREPDWSALPPATPERIRRLLLRCLARDHRERLRDIGDARLEIDAIDEVLPGMPPVGAVRVPWTALALIGVLIAGVWAAVAMMQKPLTIEQQLAAATYLHVTQWEGTELDAALSADGKFVAFVADRSGPVHVWIAHVGSEERDLTPDSPDERNRLNRPVGFSPDGSLVWLSGSPLGRRLRLIPFTGGPIRPFLEPQANSMAWSPEGTQIVYLMAEAGGDPLLVADPDGSNARRIVEGIEGQHNHFPTWSKDGRWIYFVRFTADSRAADLWRVSAAGGDAERMTEQHSDIRYPTPIDDRTVLFVARAEDASGPWLWALDVAEKKARRVIPGLARYLSVAASGDSRRLVVSTGEASATLWTVPIGERVAEESDAQAYPVPAARAYAPRFTAASLFYQSSSGAGDGLWRRADGKAVAVWKASDGTLLQPAALAADGRLALSVKHKGAARLTIVSADGAVRRTLADSISLTGSSSWSPDGKWIVTGGRDPDGPGLFMIPVDGGAARRLAPGQATDPAWSPDGALIVYAGALASGTAPLLAVRPDGSAVPLPPLRVSAQGGGCLRFLPDGTGVVYMSGRTGAQEFWVFDLATNTPRPLARLSSPAFTSTFDVTPDGRHIVFDRVRDISNIVLIDLPK